jgi:hypothetical protein
MRDNFKGVGSRLRQADLEVLRARLKVDELRTKQDFQVTKQKLQQFLLEQAIEIPNLYLYSNAWYRTKQLFDNNDASGNAVDFNAGGRKGAVVRWLIANHKSGGIMTYSGMSHIHVDVGYHFVALNSGRGR